MTGRFLGIALAGLIAAASVTPAAAASWFELNFGLFGPRYDALVPLCDDRGVLIQIHSKFSHKESEFWASNLEILGINRIREVAFRPWADATIPRRFCSGKVLTSDGRWRLLRYSIVEDGGMIGASWGVQWCVVGADRNWAYNPDCKAAAP